MFNCISFLDTQTLFSLTQYIPVAKTGMLIAVQLFLVKH